MGEENKGEFSERPEVTPAESIILPGQKKSKAATILCILFAIIAIGLGVFILCDKVLLKKDDAEKKPTAEKMSDEDASKIEAYDNEKALQKVVYGLRDVINKYIGDDLEVAEIQFDSYKAAGRVDSETYNTTSIPDSYSVVVPYSSGTKVEEMFINNSANFTLSKDIKSYLKENGFKEISELSNDFWGTQHYETDDGLVCEFPENAALPYTVVCGDAAKISDETKELVKALGKAYKDSEGEEIGFLFASKDNIEDGENGYQRLLATSANAAAWFYRESAESDWKFYALTQAAFDCSDFNTDELKNAFKGMDCWDTGKNAMTKL